MIGRTQSLHAFIQEQLNDAQRKAVTHAQGSILVIAGAGSGKTRVITARIAHLIIERNVLPGSIIALTFTNKAANEMKERIASFLGRDHELPFVGTFHSYCVRLLKKNQQLLSSPFFSILDEDDKNKMLSAILTRHKLNKQISTRSASYQISQLKNRELSLDKTANNQFTQPAMQDVFRAYEEEKQASKCLDFDDLLIEGLKLFQNNKEFKKSYQEQLKHILVDEYQDTNVVQHALLKHMAKSNNTVMIDSICAVGDEDQSIYSWRGATITNMLNFQKDFPKTELIKIEQNYRSAQPILDVANAVISNNTQRNPKELWSEKEGKDRTRILSFLSEYQEAESITRFAQIVRTTKKQETVAVLYRTHAQSRALEEALIKQSIPYKIIGGTQFYERMEIKDMLAYLKLVVNPFDRTSLFRIINVPSRGLGAKFEEQMYERWTQQPFLMYHEVIELLKTDEKKETRKYQTLNNFIEIFTQLTPINLPSKALETIIMRTNYLQHLKDTNEPEEANTRIENIKELLTAMAHFESQGTDTIATFLDEVALLQDKMRSSDDEHNKVLLMTLHAAKGLEFDSVVLAGLEEGILPSTRSLQEDDAIEEERRLFYVGITRARERILFTHSKFRYNYGQMTEQHTSRFLREIPNKNMMSEDCSYMKPAQMSIYLSDWLKVKAPSDVMTFSAAKQVPAKEISMSKTTPTKTTEQSKESTNWRINRPVTHEKYGTGLVQNAEKQSDGTLYVTVKFKSGVKRIVSDFLKLL